MIEPRSVEMAAKYSVDLRILLNTMDRPGTKITAGEAIMEENIINKVSVLDNVLLVTASGGGKSGLSGLFTKLADEKVNRRHQPKPVGRGRVLHGLDGQRG